MRGTVISTRRKLLTLALAVLLGVSALMAPRARAQGPAAQSPTVPQWETAAGGKMAFEVASVKPDLALRDAQTVNSNIPLDDQEGFSPTGSLFSSTNYALLRYIIFAYKLSNQQVQLAIPQLPKWAVTSRYDIQARASSSATKDQFRLMMQALLADRFKLVSHFETRQLPVYGLVLEKGGKLGPRIKPHPADAPCSNAAPLRSTPAASSTTVGAVFPETCGTLVGLPSPSAPGQMRLGARDVPIATLASTFSVPYLTGVDRSVLDQTGLAGNFDFTMEFTPVALPPEANFQPDPLGPTFLEALKDQLGLKLESQMGPVDVLVIDHIEQPSEN